MEALLYSYPYWSKVLVVYVAASEAFQSLGIVFNITNKFLLGHMAQVTGTVVSLNEPDGNFSPSEISLSQNRGHLSSMRNHVLEKEFV